MTGATLAARLRPAVGAIGRATDAITAHVVVALASIIAVQIALTVVLFFSVDHNGWLTYQGGDQLWLVTTGWLIGQGVLPYALVGYGWPVLLAPLTWITGASSLDLLPVTTVLQVAVLGPIATLAVYDIGARIAGRAAGLWCATTWVLLPFLAIPLFEDRYQERWTDQVLVQMQGLTQMADYPSTVLVLVAAALVLRSLDAGAIREAALAGAIAGFAIGMKPANALFLLGPAARVPARAALAQRGRVRRLARAGRAPAGGLEVTRHRIDPRLQHGRRTRRGRVAASAAHRRLVLGSLPAAPGGLGAEHVEPARVLLERPRCPVGAAGGRARGRAQIGAAAGLLLGWLLGYVIVKGSSPVSSLEAGSFWRLVMPALPAYAILFAAIPLLVPTLPRRLGARIAARPGRRPGRRLALAAHRPARRGPGRVRPVRRAVAWPRPGDPGRGHPDPGGRRNGAPHRDARRRRAAPHLDRHDGPDDAVLPRLPHDRPRGGRRLPTRGRRPLRPRT